MINKKIIIEVSHGIVEVAERVDGVDIELHDYDIQEIEENNPDRKYGHDIGGDYEIMLL